MIWKRNFAQFQFQTRLPIVSNFQKKEVLILFNKKTTTKIPVKEEMCPPWKKSQNLRNAQTTHSLRRTAREFSNLTPGLLLISFYFSLPPSSLRLELCIPLDMCALYISLLLLLLLSLLVNTVDNSLTTLFCRLVLIVQLIVIRTINCCRLVIDRLAHKKYQWNSV